jgi:hypothetical protein
MLFFLRDGSAAPEITVVLQTFDANPVSLKLDLT